MTTDRKRKLRRFSPQTLTVLSVLKAAKSEWLYGLEISAATGLKSGSLYPILIRLSEQGVLDHQWREPVRPGRPPRHAYRLTALGKRVFLEAQNVIPQPLVLGSIKPCISVM